MSVVDFVPPKLDPLVIAWAEKLLAQLRAGDETIIVAGAVVVAAGGRTAYLAVGHDEDPLLLVGALERLKLAVMEKLDDQPLGEL